MAILSSQHVSYCHRKVNHLTEIPRFSNYTVRYNIV